MTQYYSQKGEDKYLYETFFKNVKKGKYIELGAMNGITCSNTKFFEDSHQWTGILIEPTKNLYDSLVINRPNNKLYNSLVSDNIKDYDFKYFENLGVSCIVDTMPSNHDRLYFNSWRPQFKNQPQGLIKMKSNTMENIINDSGIKEFDLLSLDVEGHELNVLKSINFEKTLIHVILVEMLDDNSNLDDINNLLVSKNYVYHSDFGRNKVYVLKTSKYNN